LLHTGQKEGWLANVKQQHQGQIPVQVEVQRNDTKSLVSLDKLSLEELFDLCSSLEATFESKTVERISLFD
jgi:hypothetical protein